MVSDAKRRGKPPGQILLDRSFHHSAMSRLKDSEKRGRPDLVHVAVLSVTGTPAYLDGDVVVFVHTYPNLVLEIAAKTRIPKNYIRFRGLMEEALAAKSEGDLIKVRRMGAKELVRSVQADRVFGLSVQGRLSTAEDLAARVADARSPCIIVGGFPRGHFSKETMEGIDELVRIDARPLEAHVVASRLVYEVEKARRRTND